MEAAEAFAFPDTPLAVDYVVPMLSIDNLEVIGVHAITRHDSFRTRELLVGMLFHGDSAVVSAALDEIDRPSIPAARSKIRDMPTSQNGSNRWIALEWLAAHPNSEDLPFFEPLLRDANPAVQKQATEYAKSLKGKQR